MASVWASWIIAKQASELLRIGQQSRALELLVVRHRDISPLVVNQPEFRDLLRDVSMPLDGLNSASTDQSASTEKIDEKAGRAVRMVIICFALFLLITLIRIAWSVLQ
jgi:hypothetical protein